MRFFNNFRFHDCNFMVYEGNFMFYEVKFMLHEVSFMFYEINFMFCEGNAAPVTGEFGLLASLVLVAALAFELVYPAPVVIAVGHGTIAR